jgi:mRNA-degrading endonuclease toxin of MazEF toxin-antitoxin module
MSTPTAQVLQTAASLLNSDAGLATSLTNYATLALVTTTPVALVSQVPLELQEKQQKIVYPICQIYCDQIQNAGKVKFREFSGTYRVVVEVTHSQDRLDGLTDTLQAAADAVSDVFDRNSGNLGNGMVLKPGYVAEIDAVKKGGLHYQQSARVKCQVSWER